MASVGPWPQTAFRTRCARCRRRTFIRKANRWSLRDYSATDPGWVLDFSQRCGPRPVLPQGSAPE
ncbi:DNA alkylation repair protein [Arthrobacter sp. CG_A4]|uniref:DNA alkylation repair protein n=1 Tax=Arthrobacter sp. CG_A4 TaxID=3071706 RepID=UPI002E153A1B